MKNRIVNRLAAVLLCGGLFSTSAHAITDSVPASRGGKTTTGTVLLQQLYEGSYFHICGGMLISNNYVLTAAHCVDDASATYRVVVGEYDLNDLSGYEQEISVSQVIMHSGYDGNASGFPNDIALLRLSSQADTQGNRVTPVTIADDDFSAVTPVRWIVGWGKLNGSDSDGSGILMSATTREITNLECNSRWDGVSGTAINNGHRCLFDNPPGISTYCSGDAGGPVFAISNKGVLTAIGILSWGISTCSGVFPSVTTRIEYYRDWINSNSDLLVSTEL